MGTLQDLANEIAPQPKEKKTAVRTATPPATPRRAQRDREQTAAALVAAVGQVLARDGFKGLGVNAVARAAGVDKVLIYRYFGDLDGLVRAYAEQGDFWPSMEELTGDEAVFETLDAPAKLAEVFRNLALGLRRRPETLEILAWEMVERNELTAILEERREQQGLALLQRYGKEMADAFGDADMQAVTTLFAAATNYLAARARLITTFNGLQIREDRAWDALVDAMEAMARGLMTKKP